MRKNSLAKPWRAQTPGHSSARIHFLKLPEALIGKRTPKELNTFMEALDYESARRLVLMLAAILR